jgi:hypothetical protein
MEMHFCMGAPAPKPDIDDLIFGNIGLVPSER